MRMDTSSGWGGQPGTVRLGERAVLTPQAIVVADLHAGDHQVRRLPIRPALQGFRVRLDLDQYIRDDLVLGQVLAVLPCFAHAVLHTSLAASASHWEAWAGKNHVRQQALPDQSPGMRLITLALARAPHARPEVGERVLNERSL
jgi:hypothetical protein